MKSLKDLKKASFVALSTLALTLGLVAAPMMASAKGEDKGGKSEHRSERSDRGDRREGDKRDRHEGDRGDRGNRGDERSGDWDGDWDND